MISDLSSVFFLSCKKLHKLIFLFLIFTSDVSPEKLRKDARQPRCKSKVSKKSGLILSLVGLTAIVLWKLCFKSQNGIEFNCCEVVSSEDQESQPTENSHLRDVEVSFNRDGNINQKIIDFINSATKKIQIVIYRLEDRAILKALSQVKTRGVHVEVCLTMKEGLRAPYLVYHGLENELRQNQAKYCNDLKIVNVNSTSNLHSKFIIVDEEKLLTGSRNWVAEARNSEAVVVLRNHKSICDKYSNQFNDLKVRCNSYTTNLPKQAASGLKSFLATEEKEFASLPPYLTLDCIEAIKSAKEEILIAVQSFGHQSIADALIEKARSGVKVKIVSDSYSEIKIFQNVKQNVREYITSQMGSCKNIKFLSKRVWGKLHSKFIVIDNEIVGNGSFNFTKSAASNVENMIYIKHPTLVKEFKVEFGKIVGKKVH